MNCQRCQDFKANKRLELSLELSSETIRCTISVKCIIIRDFDGLLPEYGKVDEVENPNKCVKQCQKPNIEESRLMVLLFGLEVDENAENEDNQVERKAKAGYQRVNIFRNNHFNKVEIS